MKIGTSLFLIPFLILAEVGAFGYLIKDNQDLHEKLLKCEQTVSTQNDKVDTMQRQIDQYVIQLVEKEKEVIQAQQDVQDSEIKRLQATNELQDVKDQLVQANALIAKLSDQASAQPATIQSPAQATFTPPYATQLGTIFGGVLIILIIILSSKKFNQAGQNPRFSQVIKQTRRGQVMMTMSDQTYREFQSYLKNKK